MTEDRVQGLVDRELIHEVLVAVAHAQDDRDWEKLRSCFAPDAIYTHPTGHIDGAEQIVDRSRVALTPLDESQHLVGSISITVEGDVARSICYFQAQHVRAGAPGSDLYIIAGTYRDRLTKHDGRWRISERVQSYTWRDGNPEVTRR